MGHAAVELASRQKATHEKLRIYWDKGVNSDDTYYFTKNHPPVHHLTERPRYVLNAHRLTARSPVRYSAIQERGCVLIVTVK
jgi:hypothetical protein